MNTQKVIDKNINDYFNQTHNLSSLILENEENYLNAVAYEISTSIFDIKELKSFEDISSSLEDLEVVDNLDLLFIQSESHSYNFSNSLFGVNLNSFALNIF